MDRRGTTRLTFALVGPWRGSGLATAVIAAATLAACAQTVAAPQPLTAAQIDSAQRRWPDTTEAKLTQGRDLFFAKCNACHGYPNLEAIEESRWQKILQVMGPRATLDQKQVDAVLRYVVSVHPPPSPTPTPPTM